MKTLFNQNDKNEIISRIDNLKTTAEKQWGKMDVAQMVAHCSAALEVAAGLKFPPRIFIGRVIGSFFKPMFSNEKPFDKNTPTDKSFVMTGAHDLEKEKATLKKLIQQFSDGGPQKCTTHPHTFFGKLTPEEWGIGMYKHLDHHLRQFNV